MKQNTTDFNTEAKTYFTYIKFLNITSTHMTANLINKQFLLSSRSRSMLLEITTQTQVTDR